MNESAVAHEADLAARDAIAAMADRISERGSFLRSLFIYALDCARSGELASVRGAAKALRMNHSSLTSSARRKGIDICEIFDRVQLIRAAAVLECPDVSVGMASLILGVSSEQSFCRTITTLTRLTPARWRTRVSSRRELFALEIYLTARLARFAAMQPPSFFVPRVARAPHGTDATLARAAS